MTDTVKLGVVGAAGRGSAFEIPATEDERVDVTAVCDLSPDGVETARAAFDADEGFLDYHEMLWEADLDAVLIATPKEHHVPQSVAALERDLNVLCEVPVGRSIEECRELVRVEDQSDGVYMLAENEIYRREWMIVREMIQNGEFGEIYYVRGGRISNDTSKMERTPWRRTWRGGRNGVTYPTHVFGPILQWLPDDRIERVACVGSGHHYTDPRGNKYEQEDTVVLLGKTEQDRLVVERQDLISDRPSVSYRFEVQGTEASFESDDTGGTDHRISLVGNRGWQDLWDFEDEYLPERRDSLPAVASETGRDGGDYYLFERFIDSIVDDVPPPITLHDGLDMTLPGLVSERSISRNGEWTPVPDSREWLDR